MYTSSFPQPRFYNNPFLLHKKTCVDILGILKLCMLFCSFNFLFQTKILEDSLNRRQHGSFYISVDIQESRNANDLKLNY